MFQASIPVREIAARLGRHRGTIHREINRNFYHTSFRDRYGNDYRGYYCMTANALAKRRRRSRHTSPPPRSTSSGWPAVTGLQPA
ncbi:helix-turn-helix domain-containing protein [Azospirillum sp. RU38E]|uniref:helix-turn-helix domain-containing protein n=1 Tax=unclassified Azospirillum TaxID=2630922 RepID=UPI00352A0A60